MDDVSILNTEKKFAGALFKSFRSKRFGITTCCGLDVSTAIISKSLCDWEQKLNKTVVFSTGLTIKIIDCDTGEPVAE
jgi:hypothetical protein